MKIQIALLVSFLIAISSFAIESSVIRVKVTGKASPKISQRPKARIAALRAAKVEGYRKLLKISGYSQSSLHQNSNYIVTRGYLQGAKIVRKRYLSDYVVEITMEIRRDQLMAELAQKKELARRMSAISTLKQDIIKTEEKIFALKNELAKLKKQLKILEERIE